jgi:hypothetical protein
MGGALAGPYGGRGGSAPSASSQPFLRPNIWDDLTKAAEEGLGCDGVAPRSSAALVIGVGIFFVTATILGP